MIFCYFMHHIQVCDMLNPDPSRLEGETGAVLLVDHRQDRNSCRSRTFRQCAFDPDCFMNEVVGSLDRYIIIFSHQRIPKDFHNLT